MLIEKYHTYLSQSYNNGVTHEFNLYGKFFMYNSLLNIVLEQGLTLQGVNVTPQRLDYTTIKTINITVNALSKIYELKVIGLESNEIINYLFLNNAGYLHNTPTINYDVFLPVRLKEYSTFIKWYSEKTDIINENGKYTKPVADVTFSLMAEITLNGTVYYRSFTVNAEGKTSAEKLRDLINIYGSVNFTYIGQNTPLFSALDYQDITHEDYGITDISFSYPAISTFLQITDYVISINSYTSTGYVPLTVTAVFSDGAFSDVIDVNINLTGGGNIEQLFRYVGYYFNDIGESTVNGFELPQSYEGTNIAYSLPDSIINNNEEEIVNFIEILNEPVVAQFASVNITGISINTAYLPNTNTLTNVIVKANNVKRLFTFTAGGVLHNSTGDIPDSALFSILKTYLGLNVSRDYISLKEIEENSFTILNGASSGITSLQGLQHFSYLQKLYLTGNSISNITYLNNFTNLNYVDLSNNNLNDVSSLKNCLNIADLYLQGNTNLMSVDVIKNYTKLYNLDVDNTGCLYVLNHWAFAYAYYQYKSIYFQNPYYYYKDDLAVRVRYAPSPNNKEQDATYLLAKISTISEAYNVLVLPASMPGANGFLWTVHSGSQYVSITSNAATITRPVNDVTVILILNVYTQGNDGFSVNRAFYITLKGTGV